jgi:hypothetical protein
MMERDSPARVRAQRPIAVQRDLAGPERALGVVCTDGHTVGSMKPIVLDRPTLRLVIAIVAVGFKLSTGRLSGRS